MAQQFGAGSALAEGEGEALARTVSCGPESGQPHESEGRGVPNDKAVRPCAGVHHQPVTAGRRMLMLGHSNDACGGRSWAGHVSN